MNSRGRRHALTFVLVVLIGGALSAAESRAQESKPSEPALRASAFNGIQPGVSTMADVAESWGRPIKTSRQSTTVQQTYQVAPFERIEITLQKELVVSITIRLHQAFEAATLAEQLELLSFEPAFITNTVGAHVGMAYPERGVAFGFVPGDQQHQVSQIIIDTITAEPFLLRAESRLGTNDTGCLADVATALRLDGRSNRARVLRARALVETGQPSAALEACQEAIGSDPRQPELRLLRGKVLADLGRYEQAIAATQQVMGLCAERPDLKIRALCQLGDQIAQGPKHDYKLALDYHQQAIREATALAADSKTEHHQAAHDVLLDAHLGAAGDIAWGQWKSKPEASAKWLERAEQITAQATTARQLTSDRLRWCAAALHVCAGLQGQTDPAAWVKELTTIGAQERDALADPRSMARLDWLLGCALATAMQAQQACGQTQQAAESGRLAATHLERALPLREHQPGDSYVLGRVYFRLGSLCVTADHDHAQALGWFARALPLVEETIPTCAPAELGRQGEAAVSMAVSYWAAGQQDRALELTRKGAEWIEKAVAAGALDRHALAVPYANLAMIHEHLGADDQARAMREMAARIDSPQRK